MVREMKESLNMTVNYVGSDFESDNELGEFSDSDSETSSVISDLDTDQDTENMDDFFSKKLGWGGYKTPL